MTACLVARPGPAQAQTLPYSTYYEILPPTSGISGVQALAQSSGAVLSTDAVVGQELQGNYVDEAPIGSADNGFSTRQSRFVVSGQHSQGIIAINQEAGNLNNQGNVFVIAALAGLGSTDLSEAGLVAAARTQGNTVHSAAGNREDRIQLSFYRSSGVVGINQSAGSLNQQSNVMILTESTETVSGLFNSLSYSDLGAVVANNDVSVQPSPDGAVRRDFMHASFVDFKGMAQVNQSAGDLNAVQNAMLVSLNGFQFQ